MKNTLTYRMHYRYIRFTGGACRGNLVCNRIQQMEILRALTSKSQGLSRRLRQENPRWRDLILHRLEFTKNTNVKEKKRLPYRETLF